MHSHGDGRGDIDTRRRGRERRRARRRRARTSHRSGCPRALPCPETQPVVLSTNIVVRGRSQASSRPHSSWIRARGGRRSAPDSSPSALPCPGSQLVVLSTARRHLDVLTPMHAEASSACTVMRTGVRKATLGAGVERVAVLVAVGHGRRTALAALARCRAPSLNRSSSAPKSLCAARRRHMTPHRVLVVQSSRPLRVAMGHTSDALRSRNSASLAPRPASGRQKRLDGGVR